jgi:ElaB/YqjD/DUF883 family membrane-anchored ribosome-binding protein
MAMERGLYEDQLGGTAKVVSDTTGAFADAAGKQIDRARDSAEAVAKTVADQGRRAVSAVDRSFREQPLMTLGIVAAVALAIGALWKVERRRVGRADKRWSGSQRWF